MNIKKILQSIGYVRFISVNILFILNVLYLIPLFAQVEIVNFDNFTTRDGLSNNKIQCVFQDSEGWMWFGTNLGANRFDGYKFYSYKNDPEDSTSLIGSIVRVIFEDSKSNIWIGTENGGLNKFNHNRNNFTNIGGSQPNHPFTGNSVNAIFEDSVGNLWIGTGQGLIKFNSETDEIVSFVHDDQDSNSLCNNFIRKLLFDHRGKLWIGTNSGIDILDTSTTMFSHINQPVELSTDEIWEIFGDNKGEIWVGTYNNGTYIFNPADSDFEHLILDPTDERSNTVRSIINDKKGNYWIGTRGGLYQLNEKSGRILHYQNDQRETNTLVQNSVLDIICDARGDIWIGTRGGISYIVAEKQIFKLYKALPNDNNYLNNSDIFAFWIDNSQNIWIGTEKGGINILNSTTGTFSYIMHDLKKKGSSNRNCIKEFMDDQQGNLWIATFRGGINVYDLANGKFINHYQHNPSDSMSLSNNIVWTLHLDSRGKIWIGTESGLDSFDPLRKKFIHYSQFDYHNENIREINYIGEDSDHDLWLSGYDRVTIFRPDSGIVNIINEKTRSFYQDSEGRYWLASLTNGLVLCDKIKGIIKYYDENYGIANNRTYRILEDNNKYLWISTENGLSRFNVQEEKFRNFSEQDGLQNNQFNYNAAYKTSTGKFLFGGINGFNIFDPTQIIERKSISTIVFTDFRIFNKSVPIKEDKDAILQKSIFESDQIVLTYNQNVFSFEFAALNYAEAQHIKYIYKLEGFEKEWNESGYQRTATYTNLNPGKYTFRVKTINIDNTPDDNEASIIISVLPPWWKTLFFKISVIIIVLVLTLGFYFYRISSLEKQKLYLQKLIMERTQEIEEKNTILTEQTAELNETNTLLEERQQQIEENVVILTEQTNELNGKNTLLEERQQQIEEKNTILTEQANELNESNSLLEERQQQVEEQAEELKTQKEELEAANAHLSELNSTKDKFFSIIAHDLKNPFNTILGFAELLKTKFKKLTEEKKLKYSEVIYDSTKNIYGLLENLLQWARTQTDKIAFEPSTFSIKHLVEQNIALLKENLGKKNITVEYNKSDDYEIYADRNMINTVIRNLLNNAIKFTNLGGKIIINCINKNSNIEVSIEDTGIGMSVEETKKLFRIDTNVSKTGTDGETGTGLGLILCKEFVEKNGGSIHVESKEGKGSRFCFSLPSGIKS